MARHYLLAAGFALICITPGRADDLSKYAPKYQPHQQTDAERLQTFKPPPPPPKQDTIIDKAARAYQNAPVRPSYDPATKAPIIQYQKKF